MKENFKIRKTKPSDLDAVMTIYEKGREIMRESGNLNQWTNGYPQRELIEEDIANRVSYVAVNEADRPVGVFAFIPGEDVTYKTVYGGKWLNDEPYCTIHRIAVSEAHIGIGSFILKWASMQCKNIRIDTHADNLPMQAALKKNSFVFCGIIHLLNGDERLAYQKITSFNEINP